MVNLAGGDWNMTGSFYHIFGMSSSQLTFIFFRGVETTNRSIVLFIFGTDVSIAYSYRTLCIHMTMSKAHVNSQEPIATATASPRRGSR